MSKFANAVFVFSFTTDPLPVLFPEVELLDDGELEFEELRPDCVAFDGTNDT